MVWPPALCNLPPCSLPSTFQFILLLTPDLGAPSRLFSLPPAPLSPRLCLAKSYPSLGSQKALPRGDPPRRCTKLRHPCLLVASRAGPSQTCPASLCVWPLSSPLEWKLCECRTFLGPRSPPLGNTLSQPDLHLNSQSLLPKIPT